MIYFVAMLMIGFYFYRRTKDGGMSEYFFGGRTMNPYVTAMSAQASDMSGWLLMGLPGSIVLMGLGQAWIGIGLAAGSYICWLIAAKRIRKHTKVCGDAITVPEFFSNRYHDEKGYLRLISTIIILFFFTIYVASGFKSCGITLSAAFGMPEMTTTILIIAVIVTISYAVIGGYTAVCWADLFQAILMVVVAVLVPVMALNFMGGWGEVTSVLDSMNLENFTDLFHEYDPTTGIGSTIAITSLVSSLAWGLGYFGMPHIVVRYMSIRNPNEIKVARRVSLVWIIIALASVCIMAVIGRAFMFSEFGMQPEVFDDNGNLLYGEYNAEEIFLKMAATLFGPFICGIVFAAILAAIMSTVDSQLLVCTSSITNDILGKSKRFNLSEKKLTLISRFVVVIIAIIAFFIVMIGNDSIMDLVSYAWSGFGSAFGPLMLLSIFWKRMNSQGAMASMIAGFATVLIWQTFLESTGIYSLLPGFIIAMVVGVVVALLTAPPSQEIQDEFDAALAYDEPMEKSA